MNMTPEPTHVGVRLSPGRYAVIVVSGDFDLAGVPVFERALRKLKLPADRRVVLDLHRVAFIDVPGLRAVLDFHAACRKADTALAIVPGPRHVQRIFELTGTDRCLPFVEGGERAHQTR